MAKNRITFFACDNGDASLIEAHGWTIMTDINYRSAATDDDDDVVPDFAPKIRDACDNDRLDIFVLTHPDEDHLRGFGDVFHLGKPGERDDDPDEGDVKIIVDEMWCSSYAVDPNYTTEISKPVLDEIQRRYALQDTAAGALPGNRLKVLTADMGESQLLTAGIEWRLLAPNETEADIPASDNDEQPNSSNPSSLVIQWTVTVGGAKSQILLTGDAPFGIWERLDGDLDAHQLEWHILQAPHHCSRHSMGWKETRNGDEVFEWSDEAISALDHPIGYGAHVVSSSRKFSSKTPPHQDARDRYRKIIARGGPINNDVKKRFKCTAGNRGEKPDDIVFNFTSRGPSLVGLTTTAAIVATPSSAGGGGYGRN